MKDCAQRSRAHAHRHCDNERGAVLLEASFGIILLFIICSGILDYASTFASTIDVAGAVRSGARTGAVTTATGPMSDYQIVQSVIQKSGSKRDNVEKLIIYKADAPNAKPNAGCIAANASLVSNGEKCNIYTKDDLALGESAFSNLQDGKTWPSAQRQPGADFIGVWVQASRQPLMKAVWSPSRYSDSFTLRIAPEPISTPAAGWTPGVALPDPGFDPDNWSCWEGRGCAADGGSGGEIGTVGGDGSGGK